MFRGKEENYIFLDKNYTIGNIKEHSSIILSPSFYWIKKEKLPVKSIKEAKKVAGSLFDYLPNFQDLKFIVKKENDYYLFIAYNPKEIVAALKEKGIPKPNGIYLAQEAFYKKNVVVNETDALITVDDVVVKTPLALFQEKRELQTIDLDNFHLKEHIKISYFSVNVMDKEYLKIAAPLAIIALLFAIESILLYKVKNNLFSKREVIAKEYNLPLFDIQLNSIKSALEKKENEQTAIRKKIEKILSVVNKAKAKVVSLDFKKGGCQFEIETASKKSKVSYIKDMLRRHGFKVRTQQRNKTTRFECS